MQTENTVPPPPASVAGGYRKRRARSISLRLKLMVYFLVILALPLVTLGIIGPSLYAASIERESMAHTERMIGQVNMNIELRVLEMEKLIDMVARTDSVIDFLEAGNERAREAIRGSLAVIVATHPEIAGMLVVAESGEWLGEGFSRTTRDSLTEERWYVEARAAPDKVRLVARPIGRNIRSTRRFGADEVVSIVKAVADERDGSARGAVLVDMRLSAIEELFTDPSLGDADFLFIADARGEMVYAPVNEIVYRVPLGPLEGGTRSDVVRVGGADYQVLSRESAYTGWRTVGLFSLPETLREVGLVKYWTFLVGGITMALAIVLAFFFMSSIAKPVLRLRSLMKRVEHGDLAVRFAGKGGDEIAELGLGFDEMIERIQSLIEQVYREQQSKREAELRILQEQIKPHFLYNTLDTIQWMAQEHRVDDVVCMVGALTSLFRIGLSKGREVIPLPDELEHVRSYLCIQKMRYEDKFDYEIAVDEGLLGYRVMRLVLQPLVENAIYHGIKERRGHGTLSVAGRLQPGRGGQGFDLVLAVRDDGVGMDPARLARLNSSLEDGGGYLDGYGIRNVHERIRLTFGKPYGLFFRSAPGEGTEAMILHPVIGAED